MSKKVLILYEKMGMGHLRMANILEDMLKDEEDVEIVKCAGSELLGDTSIDLVVNAWNTLVKKNLIRTVNVVINFLARILLLPVEEVNKTARFLKIIEEINPDIIVSPSDMYNKILGTYSQEKGIPFYIVVTEISTFLDIVNPHACHICYFDETTMAIRNYDFNLTYFSYRLNKETGILNKIEYVLGYYKDYVLRCYKNSIFKNPNKPLERLNDAACRVIGPLAEKKHFTYKNVDEIKRKYNLTEDRDNVVVVSGSIGGKFLVEMAAALSKSYTKPINLLVMCGRDEATYNKMLKFKNTNPNVNIMTFGYTESFDEFISIADCLVVRPSAGIFIESLLGTAPIVTFDLVTTNDKGSLTMIEKYKLGEVCRSKSELIPALERLLESKSTYKENIEKLRSMYVETYEEKKQLLKEIILEGEFIDFQEKGSLEIEAPFGTNVTQ